MTWTELRQRRSPNLAGLSEWTLESRPLFVEEIDKTHLIWLNE